MIFITCSGNEHYFNNIMHEYNHRLNPGVVKAWDRKCDCGKKKISKKDLEQFIKENMKHGNI